MQVIQHGKDVICVLYDTSLCRIEPNGNGHFSGGSDEWKKRRIPIGKGKKNKKGQFRMAAEWEFKMDSQEQAVDVMRGLNDLLQTPEWNIPTISVV